MTGAQNSFIAESFVGSPVKWFGCVNCSPVLHESSRSLRMRNIPLWFAAGVGVSAQQLKIVSLIGLSCIKLGNETRTD